MSEQRDIIDRLRDRDAVVMSGLFHAIPAMNEAADEIARLRSICNGTVWEENERLRAQLTDLRGGMAEARKGEDEQTERAFQAERRLASARKALEEFKRWCRTDISRKTWDALHALESALTDEKST